jgi:SAM-dependent methyltransferase
VSKFGIATEKRLKTEEGRIKKTYAIRDASGKNALYGWQRYEAIYTSCRQQATWAQALKKAGFETLAELEILDVGCGSGTWLRMLTEWGATPGRLHGVDLLEDRIAKATSLSPLGIDFKVSNSWPLPYRDSSMDICAASTVFSSILDSSARQALAQEMDRVLRIGGWVMVFDYAVSDPRNPDTVGIGKGEIRSIFPSLRLVHTNRLILAPPLLRRFPKYLMWIATGLEILIPFLCSHRIYMLYK